MPDCNEINCCCCQIKGPSSYPNADPSYTNQGFLNPNNGSSFPHPDANYPHPISANVSLAPTYPTYPGYTFPNNASSNINTLSATYTNPFGADRDRSRLQPRDAVTPPSHVLQSRSH